VAERNEKALIEARHVLIDIEKGLKLISGPSEPSNNDYVTILTLGPDPRTSIKWPINRFIRDKCLYNISLRLHFNTLVCL
jgi:hypothetical protein